MVWRYVTLSSVGWCGLPSPNFSTFPHSTAAPPFHPRKQAGDLRTRRASAAQHHTLRLQQIRSGKTESGASPEEIAAAVQVRGAGAVFAFSVCVQVCGRLVWPSVLHVAEQAIT